MINFSQLALFPLFFAVSHTIVTTYVYMQVVFSNYFLSCLFSQLKWTSHKALSISQFMLVSHTLFRVFSSRYRHTTRNLIVPTMLLPRRDKSLCRRKIRECDADETWDDRADSSLSPDSTPHHDHCTSAFWSCIPRDWRLMSAIARPFSKFCDERGG